MVIVSYVFYFCLFGISRLWFFADFPIPQISADSANYVSIAGHISTGQWPLFAIRPPGFPLLIALTYAVSNKLFSLVVVQNLLTLLAGLSMLTAVQRLSPYFALPTAFALSGWACGNSSLEYDTSLLAESLLASCYVFAFSFLLWGIATRHYWPLLLASFFMAWAIMTKPAALFLLVIYLLIVAFLFHNRFAVAALAAFALPLPCLLLLLSAYNYAKIGSFTINAYGENELSFATLTFWEQDPSYPQAVNDAIVRTVAKLNLSEAERHILHSSWQVAELAPIFLKGFNHAALAEATALGSNSDYFSTRAWLRKISFDAIKKHPSQYYKFVRTFLLRYYLSIKEVGFLPESIKISSIPEIYLQRTYSAAKGRQIMTMMAKEYADANPPAAVKITNTGISTHVELSRTPTLVIYIYLHKIITKLFAQTLWSYAYFAMLVITTIRLWQTKAHHAGTFIVFIFTLAVLGASLVVSLVEYSQKRYSYPMEWVYYLCITLSPILWAPNVNSQPTFRQSSQC